MKGICRYCYRIFEDASALARIIENTAENPISDQEYEDIEIEADERGIILPDENLDLGVCHDCDRSIREIENDGNEFIIINR